MSQDATSAKEVGARIARVRALLGLTQLELARRAHVNRADVSLWETGKQRPSPPKAARVCEALGIELNYLLLGKTEYLRHGLAVELADKAS